MSDKYEGRAKVAIENTDENDDLMQKHNVQDLPALLLFKNGVKVAERGGLVPPAAMNLMIDEALV